VPPLNNFYYNPTFKYQVINKLTFLLASKLVLFCTFTTNTHLVPELQQLAMPPSYIVRCLLSTIFTIIRPSNIK
jgi:hypothetical protein